MFQSTHPRRVWHLQYDSANLEHKFQSTHPRRVWLTFNTKTSWFTSFNPHTHEGCDSISRLLSQSLLGFNPHTHEGCDGGRRIPLNEIRKFQSTHPRRVWLIVRFLSLTMPVFQSTHPRRVWHTDFMLGKMPIGFNPHTHEGCDFR